MQKKLIALAIAGLSSTAAFAQSNVTVYGVIDETFESVKATGATTAAAATAASADKVSRNRVTSNSSYVGFKGEEGLGNGLKAKFLFEAAIAADTGAAFSSTSARDSYVGLEGGFGELRLGQFNSAVRTIGSTIDFAPGYTGIGTISNVIGTVAGIKTGSDDRIGNAVGYYSPNFSGFQATAIYGANEAKADGSSNGTSVSNKNNNRYDLGLSYNNGPLYIAYAYDRSKDLQSTTLSGFAANPLNDKLTVNRLGAKYSFPTGTTVSALWDSQKYDASLSNSTSTVNAKRNAWSLGVKQDFAGNQAVYASYTKANKLKGSATGSTTFGDGTAVKEYTVGYLYNLSKRTQVKAYYTALKNDSNVNTDFYNTGIGGVANGADPKGYGVGLRHSF